jgi:hypothetical protein
MHERAMTFKPMTGFIGGYFVCLARIGSLTVSASLRLRGEYGDPHKLAVFL